MVGRIFIYHIKVLLLLCSTNDFLKDKVLMNKAFEALEGLNNVTFESIPVLADGDASSREGTLA